MAAFIEKQQDNGGIQMYEESDYYKYVLSLELPLYGLLLNSFHSLWRLDNNRTGHNELL